MRTFGIIVMIAMLSLLGISCEFAHQPEGGGTLVLNLRDGMSRNIFTTSNDMAGNDMDIQSYRIHLSLGGFRGESNDPLYTYDRQAVSDSLVFEALAPGSWSLVVEGFNDWDATNNQASGAMIARVPYAISFSIRRGVVTSIGGEEAMLVPITGYTGTVSVTVDWSDAALPDELYDQPDVQVTLKQINDKFLRYPTVAWTVSEGVTDTTQTKRVEQVAGAEATLDFTSIPVGWYEVLATLTSQSGVEQLKRLGYVRVVYDNAAGGERITSALFTITDGTSFATGSLGLSISEDMDPLAVSFPSTDPLVNSAQLTYPNDDGFDATIAGTFGVTVSGMDSSSTLAYAWYVNGTAAVDEDASDAANQFTYSFAETGQYTVTAVVQESNTAGNLNWGTSSFEVTVVPQPRGDK